MAKISANYDFGDKNADRLEISGNHPAELALIACTQIMTKAYAYLMIYESIQGETPTEPWNPRNEQRWLFSTNSDESMAMLKSHSELKCFLRAKRLAIVCEVGIFVLVKRDSILMNLRL